METVIEKKEAKPKEHALAQTKKLTCGSCQWFTAGYEGNNCQKTRGVVIDEPACFEYAEVKPDPFVEMAKDKYIQQIRAEIRESLKVETYKALATEVQKFLIHIQTYSATAGQVKEAQVLKEALQMVVACRYRVSEIYTTALDHEAKLDKLKEKIYVWLLSRYSEMRDMKNEKLKQAAVYRVAPEILEFESEIGRLKKLSGYIDSKIDSNDKTIQKILDAVRSTYFNPSKVM